MKIILLPIILCLLLISSCGSESTTTPEQENEQANNAETSREAKAWQLIADGAVVIDVRSKEEFDSGHLEQARLMPHDQIAELIPQTDINKDQQILVYCRSGNRAGKAQAALEGLGYQHVFNGGGYEPLIKAKP